MDKINKAFNDFLLMATPKTMSIEEIDECINKAFRSNDVLHVTPDMRAEIYRRLNQK